MWKDGQGERSECIDTRTGVGPTTCVSGFCSAYSGFHTDRPVVHLQRPADCEIQERSSQLSRKTNLEILVILQNLLL